MAVTAKSRSKTGEHLVRDLDRTRDRILNAALREFSAKGMAGARTEAIARRAGVNKRMLYYCFGSKRALYAAVMRRKIADKIGAIESTPEDFTDALLYWYEISCADREWLRMMQWEALGTGRGAEILAAERRELFRKVVARLRRTQQSGRLARGIDLEQLFISVIALTTFPTAFSQMTRQVTGLAPENPRFRLRRKRMLKWLADRLTGDSRRAAVSLKSARRPGRIARRRGNG